MPHAHMPCGEKLTTMLVLFFVHMFLDLQRGLSHAAKRVLASNLWHFRYKDTASRCDVLLRN